MTPPADRDNSIEFRRRTCELPWDPGHVVPTVEVVIDGRTLSEHFMAAGSAGSAVLLGDDVTAELGLWGPDAPAGSQAPEGFVPVLTCACTVYGCGGSYARVRFEGDTVRWSDFHNEGTDEPVDIGPFTFDRQQYERARRDFEASC